MKRHRAGQDDRGPLGAVPRGAPGKRTRTGSLMPSTAGQGAVPPSAALGEPPAVDGEYDDPFGLHLSSGGAGAGTPGGGSPGASTPPERQVSAEPRITALLRERIGAGERQRILARRRKLIDIFEAIPENQRDLLLERVRDPADELGRLIEHELSPQLRRELLAILRGESSPSPDVIGSEDVTTFTSTLGQDRFVAGESAVTVVPNWRGSRAVDVFVRPGMPPPESEGATAVHWRLLDRTGAPAQRGTETWAVGEPAPSPWSVDVTEPGQWLVDIEVVHDGLVIATAQVSILVRVSDSAGPELVRAVKSSAPRVAAQNMSTAELAAQTDAIRGQLGAYALGKKGADDEGDVIALRSALRELEWQGSQRVVDGEPVVAPDDPGALTTQDAKAGATADAGTRALLQRRIDALIAKRGLVGADLAVMELERDLADEGESVVGGVVNEVLGKREAVPWLREEVAARRAEAVAFLERFDQVGRAITYGLLAESESRVRSEIERYQVAETQAGGGYSGQGLKAGGDVGELRDVVEFGRRIQTTHAAWTQAERARTRDGAGDEKAEEARRLFEATREVALAKHPMLRPFLEGTTQQARIMPSGAVPGILEVGNYTPEQFAKFMGWELNQKLADIGETRENIADDTLSIFGVPKVVALARQEMRVAPGSMLDGAVNERAANVESSRGWTQGLVAAISFGLGLLLAVPTGGTSIGAGTMMASEVTLLVADLYLMGKDFEERGVYRAAANTDTTSVDSLLQEEPAAGPIIFGFLGFAGPVAGVGGMVRSADDLARAYARAREGVDAVRELRVAAFEAGGDLARPAVAHRIERLREVGLDAGLTDEQLDAMVRTVSRGVGVSRSASQALAKLESSAQVTDDMLPDLARQLGVERVTRGGAGGAVAIRPTMTNGRLLVADVIVGPTARVADVLAHSETVARVAQYDGLLGKLRSTWDELRGVRNPHPPFSRGHEAFEEVHKYEGFIRVRMTELTAHLTRGGSDGATAAARIEDEIRLMEGELAHWRGVLDEVRRTGNAGVARGLIEARDISAVTDEAIAAGYPKPPSDDYFYRRWPGGGPDGQEFQLLRHGADEADLTDIQVRKHAGGWELGPTNPDAAKNTGPSATSSVLSTAADPVESALRARLHSLGVDSAATQQLVDIASQAGVPLVILAKVQDEALRAAAAPAMLQELKAVLALRSKGRIDGVAEWMIDSLPKLKENPSGFLAELRDAQRLAAEHPGKIIAIGRDHSTVVPVDPVTGGKLKSFDSEVRTAGGVVERSVELETLGEVRGVRRMYDGVSHAVRKARNREAAGAPVPGQLEASIAIDLVRRGGDKKSGLVIHDQLGNRQLYTRDGQIIDQGNIFDSFTEHLPKIQGNERLSHVTIVDMNDGHVFAQYERLEADWKRVR